MATAPSTIATPPLHAPDRTRRSRALSLTAWVLLVEGFVLIGGGGLALLPLAVASYWPISRVEIALGTLAFVVGWQVLVAALGVYLRRPWGWSVAMILQALSLAAGLANYWLGHPAYVLMLASVVAVVVLNQEEVREAFSARGG
jgi:hypothetical protein